MGLGSVTDRYTVGGFDPADLPAGTSVLLLAHPDEQRRLARGFLAASDGTDDYAIAVGVGTDDFGGGSVRVVDCADGSGAGDVRTVGVRTCRSLDRTADRAVRLAVCDLDGLLEAVDVQTAYRFFHLVANTVARTSSVGLFGLDADRHDRKAANVYRRAFDYVADARTAPDDDPIPLSPVG